MVCSFCQPIYLGVVLTADTLQDLYNEVFEIIDSCTFSAKSISPTMWQAFELLHKTFKAGAELYLEGMFAYCST